MQVLHWERASLLEVNDLEDPNSIVCKTVSVDGPAGRVSWVRSRVMLEAVDDALKSRLAAVTLILEAELPFTSCDLGDNLFLRSNKR